MKKHRKRIWILALAAGAVVLGYYLRLYDRHLFNLRTWWYEDQLKERSLWLNDYEVVLEAVPVPEVEYNLSGLTWNGDTGTLFAVVNAPPRIVELSREGVFLRRIVLRGFKDTEAVEYIGDGAYIVANERSQKIVRVEIDENTTEIDAEGLPALSLGLGKVGNIGLEGLAWDAANRKLYAAKEKWPFHIYEVTGFPHHPDVTLDIEVAIDRDRDNRLFVTDLSGLDFNEDYQHLLALSHESRVLIEIDKNGKPVSRLSLVAGHGLSGPVLQPEGIATDDDNNLYVVAEPNLFYKFRKPGPPEEEPARTPGVRR